MSVKTGKKPKGKGKKTKSNVKCGNGGQECHTEHECWREGGGTEGQGPNQKKKKDLKPTTNSANPTSNENDDYALFCSSTFKDLAATS
jgi:hypothetical protein